jgi:hypothetical protein
VLILSLPTACPKPCDEPPFYAFTMPLYLAQVLKVLQLCLKAGTFIRDDGNSNRRDSEVPGLITALAHQIQSQDTFICKKEHLSKPYL